MTLKSYQNDQALVQVDSYGKAINRVGSADTATYQRSSVLKLQYQVYWDWKRDVNLDHVADYLDAVDDPTIAEPHLKWIRDFYRDVYGDTDGVPVLAGTTVPGADPPNTDGCYINYPDTDLGTHEDAVGAGNPHPWYRLYYGDNYERLRRAKSFWDPRQVFRHAQSVPPDTA